VAGDEETRLRAMAADARAYLAGLGWWTTIDSLELGCGIGGVVAVFRAEATPASEGVDSSVWVVVGDLPPLYLVTDRAPEAVDALDVYIELMQEWVYAVRAQRPVDDLPPVNAPPTRANAEALDRRLALLREIVAEAREDA
jgi:hypothetical protein